MGLVFLVLAADGRIERDAVFIKGVGVREPLHPSASREARANALAAVSVRPGHDAYLGG